LIGAKPGDEVKVKVTFPGEYGVEALSGKDAVFDVEVKEVAKPKDIPVDDEFAKRLGLEDLDKLKEAVGEQIKNEYSNFSDARVKRELLDILDDEHAFEVPEKLVEQEFASIWQQVLGDLEKAKRTFEDEDTTEEIAKTEYRVIAERRVRLGLVLSQVGKAGDIQISDDEVNQALMERAREFPGQEKEVFEYYTKQAGAINEIRAPIYEQKVVNYIIELAQVTEKKVSAEELMRDPDEEEVKDDKKKPAAKKKAAPKKAPAKKAAAKKKDD
jgi:trigger factor